MTLLVLGLNHRTAPIELRERLTIDSEQLPAALYSLAERVAPGVILSTCNRLEIYTLTNALTNTLTNSPAHPETVEGPLPGGSTSSPRREDAADPFLRLREFVADYSGVPLADLLPYCYQYREGDCVKHLFRVASGLDSMVVGEWEILGQVRAAFSAASTLETGLDSGLAAGSETGLGTGLGTGRGTGPGYLRGPLSRLFHQAFRVGRRVHHDANLGANFGDYRRRSVSHVGVRLVHRLLGNLSQKQVLLIGAGSAGQLAGRALAAAGAGNLVVTNRTYSRAEELSGELGGVAAPFELLSQTLADSDVVISTTASPDYLLRRTDVQEIMARRSSRPLLLIDIAVPRDIDPEVGVLDGVLLYDIDGLSTTSDAASVGMEPEISRAEEMVSKETAAFMDWWESLDTISAIASIREYAENIRRAEVAKTVGKLRSQWASGSTSSPRADSAYSSVHPEPVEGPEYIPAHGEPVEPLAAAGSGFDASQMSDLDALAAHLDAMTSALVKKLLHHPTVYLREAKDPTRQQMILEMFRLGADGRPDGEGRGHDRS